MHEIRSKFIFIDAPMGSGKTTLISNFCKRDENKKLNILLLTFRQALAKYLANIFNLNCYLDKDVWNDISKQKKIVVCVDSLKKINYDICYDILILDECLFIKTHLVMGTISSVYMENTIFRLCKYFRETKQIIMMQHEITNNCIEFYCSLNGLSPNSSNIKKFKFQKKVDLLPLQVIYFRNNFLAKYNFSYLSL